MKVLAIDPGTSNTGTVIIEEDTGVIYSKTISHKGAIKDDQDALMARANLICEEIVQLVKEYDIDVVVIEGFVNFGVRSNLYTSQTPFLVGAICRTLCLIDDISVRIQLSRTVLKKPRHMTKRDYPPTVLEALENVQGAKESCTNEHLRSALAHGYYFLRSENKKRNHNKED